MPFLLERLAAATHGLDGRPEAFDEPAAIAAQLQRLVSGRTLHAGGASAVLRWGLPNAVELGNGDMVALGRYAEALKLAIQEHEPRLADVSVSIEPLDDPLMRARLIVSASRAADPDERQFVLTLPR